MKKKLTNTATLIWNFIKQQVKYTQH